MPHCLPVGSGPAALYPSRKAHIGVKRSVRFQVKKLEDPREGLDGKGKSVLGSLNLPRGTMEGQRIGRTKGPLTCLIHQRVGLGQAHLVAQVYCWAPLPQKRQEISRHITNKGFWGPSSLSTTLWMSFVFQAAPNSSPPSQATSHLALVSVTLVPKYPLFPMSTPLHQWPRF